MLLSPLLAFVATAASAASPLPPSSTLTGPAGTLAWSVTPSGAGVTIDGKSPKWTVHHVAAADLSPIHTDRTDAAGKTTSVDYSPGGAVIHVDGKDISVRGTDLWDGDTVDIRLGQRVAAGADDVVFQAVDAGSGSVYGFEAMRTGQTTCGASPCTEVHLVMTGVYRLVGPSWDYWYGAAGRLLRFKGPIGAYAVGGAP